MLIGESLLTLPERPRQAEDFAPKFATSETAIPLHQEILRPSDNKRTITTDVETGWVEIRIEDDFGKAKNLEQSLITGGMGVNSISSTPTIRCRHGPGPIEHRNWSAMIGGGGRRLSRHVFQRYAFPSNRPDRGL